MVLRHLIDTEIQDYLDGNLPPIQAKIMEEHLESCNSCQNELSQYRSLYMELKNEIGINLSPNFSKSVISKIQQQSPETFYIRIRDIFLSIIGLLVAVSTSIYVVDFKPLAKAFTNIFSPQIDDSIEVFSNIKELLVGLNINVILFIFAGVVLLVIIAIDRMIFRHKDKLFAFLRTPPTLCHL